MPRQVDASATPQEHDAGSARAARAGGMRNPVLASPEPENSAAKGGPGASLPGVPPDQGWSRPALHGPPGAPAPWAADGACARLPLLLPRRVVEESLVPHGHMAEIARRCCVRIDLEAVLPGDLRTVTLTGPVVANALAVLHLQWRTAQYL